MATEETQTISQANASVVAAGLGVSLRCLWERLGSGGQATQPDPAAGASQLALQPVSRTLEILEGIFHEPEAVRVWLHTPHPDLDGCTALETILDGHAPAVCVILENALAGVPV